MSGSVNLEGKVAVVTGAGRGLGRAYAQALATAGAGVLVNDVDEGAAAEVVDTITAAGGRAVAQIGAVGPTEVAQVLVDRAVSEFGRLDIMCTNAGILRDRVLWKMSDDDFDSVVETHLRGTFTCARAAVIQMREQGDGGRLLLVGSPAGQRGNFGQTNYSACKAGIGGFTRTWAMECARNQITVNALIPQAFTEMVASMPIYAPLVERMAAGEPLPRAIRQLHALGTIEDAAPLAVFLASDAAEGVTGQCIGIGGDKLSLWSHPTEVATAFMDGGWTPETIAELWAATVGQNPQSVGVVFPEMPDLS